MPNTPKLTPDQRQKVYEMYREGRQEKSTRGRYTCAEIAEKFGVSAPLVHYLGNGER